MKTCSNASFKILQEQEPVPQKETPFSKTPGPDVGPQIKQPWENLSMNSTVVSTIKYFVFSHTNYSSGYHRLHL